MRRRKYIIAGLIFLLTLGLLLFGLMRRTVIKQTLIDPHANFKGIVPGETKKDEVYQKLGPPVKDDFAGTLSFTSTSQVRLHEVIFNKDVVKVIKEVVTETDGKNYLEDKKKYGEPEITLFGGFGEAYPLLGYPSQGVAYVANPRSGSILEIWRFTPVSIGQFETEYAKGYSRDLPHEGE